MNRKIIIRALFTAAFLVLMSSVTYSQDTSQTIKVALNVSADNLTKSQLYSSIEKRLTGFKDVKIVTRSQADYIIMVQELHAENKAGRDIGYAAYLLITAPVTADDIIRKYATAKVTFNTPGKRLTPEQTKKFKKIKRKVNQNVMGEILDKYLSHTVLIIYRTLYTSTNLNGLAKRIAADINYHLIAKVRK
jgi:hypothetical protein